MMSLFFKKLKVWFEEAAANSKIEHALRYDFRSISFTRQYSIRIISLTFFTVVWMVISFPFQAQAQTSSEPNPEFYNNNFQKILEESQSLTVGDAEPQIVHRDAITAVAAPVPETPKRIVPAGPVGTPTEAQAYAQSLVGSGDEWACLYNLWARESGWRVEANNTSSGAYGIPQALPGSKMASAGADWQTSYVTQINWGLGYINGRYGSPCGAWTHSEEVGWY